MVASPTTQKLTCKPEQCGHCGNRAPMFIVCEGKRIEREAVDDVPELGVEFEYVWQVLICPSCERVNIFQHYTCSEEEDISSDGVWRRPVHTELLYPSTRRKFRHLPPSVSRSYEIALKLLLLEPIVFAVFAGRTLEFLCRDRNAQGSNLAEMLNDLAKRGEIPTVLTDMAHSLRFFRNIGAHASEIEVSREDALALRDLCDTILEYVYEAPAMLRQVQERIKQLRTVTANDNG